MKFALAVLASCLFFSLCTAPRFKDGNVGSSSTSRIRRTRFTQEEDNLIIEEVLRFPENPPQIFGQTLWEYVLEKHRQKWKQNTTGFPCERPRDSLRKRLTDVLIHNYPHVKAKVPDALFEKYPQLKENKPQRDARYLYSSMEKEFILEELLKPSYKRLHASSTWEAIRKKHDEKRKKGLPGFEHERSPQSLRKHMAVMKQGGQLPKEVAKRLRKNLIAGSSSRSTQPDETTEAQEIEEYQDDEEWVADVIQEFSDADLGSKDKNASQPT